MGSLYRTHPVVATLVSVICFGCLADGMLWGSVQPFEIWDLLHVWSWMQLFRVLMLPFYIHTAGEMIFSVSILMSAGKQLEAQWSSRTLASFFVSTHLLGWVFRLILFRIAPSYSTILPGPYFLCFASIYAAYLTTPTVYSFTLHGIKIDATTPFLLFALQLSLLHGTDTLLMAVAGVLAGVAATSPRFRKLPSPISKVYDYVIPKRVPFIRVLTSQLLLSHLSPEYATL